MPVSQNDQNKAAAKNKAAKKPKLTPKQVRENKAMVEASDAFDDVIVADIAKREKSAIASGAASKTKTADKNAAKIDVYADLISLLAGETFTKSGNLPRERNDAINHMLIERAGIKPANAKRYKDNSVKAAYVFDLPTQSTPEYVRDFLAKSEIKTEVQLKKEVFSIKDVDPMQKLAETLYGKTNKKGDFKASKYGQDDWDKFLDACEIQKAARTESDRAAAAATAKTTEEVETVNAIVEKMQGAA